MIASVAGAGEMQSPRMSAASPDWDAAAASLPDKPAGTTPEIFSKLNAALGARYPGIAQSPVPVLLPLDPAPLLKDPKAEGADAVLGGFRPSKFFLAGPAGYDVTFFIDPGIVPDVDGSYSKPAEVELTGAAYVYELDGPDIAEVREPKNLDGFPGIRRILREAHVRYAFERFGVPYVVSIECFDGRPRPKRLSCHDADQIALRFLRTLHVVGGTSVDRRAGPHVRIERPQTQSLVFTYYPSGNLIDRSGYKSLGGRPDDHVYAQIRFPLVEAPSFAKSQSFNPWGDCYRTGRNGRLGRKGALYSCKRNGLPLVFDESSPQNFSYPWRDNFCEARDRQVGQCPGGYGHQGQDIRPSSCVLRNAEADRCEPYQHNVAAVHDGMIWRNTNQVAAYVVVNAADAHIRARYIHMHPKQMDADGLFSGKVVRQGDIIGKVGTFDEKERGTSYHLHFDMQVMTRDGWVWVNPYMTLVASYERLISARGTELPKEEPPVAAAPAPPPPTATTEAQKPEQKPEQTATEPSKPVHVAEQKTEHKAEHKRVTEQKAARKKLPVRHHAAKKQRPHQAARADASDDPPARNSY